MQLWVIILSQMKNALFKGNPEMGYVIFCDDVVEVMITLHKD